MSVSHLAPVGASIAPEPPPRDYSMSQMGQMRRGREEQTDEGTNLGPTAGLSSIGQASDPRIRERIEACRLGMVKLETLRNKHVKLMEEMRGRLPVIPGCADVQARIKRSAEGLDRFSLQSVQSVQSVDSGLSSISQTSTSQLTSTRCSSPAASHRSSVSSDSLYSSDTSPAQPSMPYSTFRKISLEKNEIPKIPVVTTSRFTNRRHGLWKKPDRPRSMYDKRSQCFEDDEDSNSKSAQPAAANSPPVQRKLAMTALPTNRAISTHSLFPSSAVASSLFSSATLPSQSSPHPPAPVPHRTPLAPVRFPSNSNISASPQTHRPLRTAQKPDIVKLACPVKTADVVFHASRIFMDRSPSADRKQNQKQAQKQQRPMSLFDAADTYSGGRDAQDEPLYATPAKVKDIIANLKHQSQQKHRQEHSHQQQQQQQQRPSHSSPVIVKRQTAFVPVVSKIAVTGPGAELIRNATRMRIVDKKQWKEWKESEGL